MANVTLDDRSFLIDEQRVWLVSGSVHYFRTPAALWRDRLLKAKRAGLNCVTTYVAWNFHEPVEGEWDFEGDRDVAAFVRLAQELGLYVILRPGPYICAEWDFGGFPGWLVTKSGITYRTNNAAYTHYFDKYFRQILGRLAEFQVSRGGNIILIQNENEYTQTAMPERSAYLEFISQLFRRAGFDIPIVSCNYFTDPPVPEAVECLNGWGNEVQLLKQLSVRQPGAPLLFTEYWCGWFDCWGGSHAVKDDAEVARRALEILGCGGQYNYYMFHGGTNFGFWGGRQEGWETAYQTTSYDYDAPLAEGGGLTDKYYLTRLVNLLANHMGPFFAECFMEEPPTTVHDSTNVLNTTGTLGRWAVVTNNGREEITSARISLPRGTELDVSLEPLGATAVPINLALSESQTLDYANLMPLGEFGEKVLVFHGPEGWPARISVNNQEVTAEVPDGDDPKVIEHEELCIVLVNSDLAQRTWPLEESILFGPRFVGESDEDLVHAPGAKQYAILDLEGKLTHKKLRASGSSRKPAAPRLGSWSRVSVCREPVAKPDELEWTSIPGPRDVDRLGVPYGYVWYRVEIDAPRAKRRKLFLPECEDRATLYLNGNLLGTWGRGEDAKREPLGASFRKGTNALTAMVDNLGRMKTGPRLGELKGLFGHIYDAKPLKPTFRLKAQDGFNKRIVPRQFAQVLPTLEKLPVYFAEASIPMTKVAPVHLSFTGLAHDVAVICNERNAGFFPGRRRNFGDVALGPLLKKGRNVLRLVLWGETAAKELAAFKLHALTETLSEKAKWSWRPWKMPEEGGHVVGKDQPAWYVSKFKYTPTARPLFLHIVGARKGQVFINGHNAGRFWTTGPQQHYYLPECWLEEQNELLIFEESGRIPAKSRLSFRPLGPYID